jgi:hypothetical protein
MEQPPRPFGLVLMTGLNTAFGLYNLAAAVQFGFALAVKLGYAAGGLEAHVYTAFLALPTWFVAFELGASLVKAPLLLISGWGYYNNRRYGRRVGNLYAVASIAESVVPVIALPYGVSGGTFIGILYPVFTLLAVNTMFKPMLTR